MGIPFVYPTGTTIYKKDKCWNGYTLMPFDKKGTALINMNGKVVHFWKDTFPMPAKMLPNGHVLTCLGERDKKFGYQDHNDLTELDWDGNVIWSFDSFQELNDDGNVFNSARQHHDYQIEGNPVGYYVPGQECRTDFNKILLLCHDDVRRRDISPQLLIDDVLIEINREGEILWRWNALDHFDEYGFSNEEKLAIFRDPNTQKRGAEGLGDILHLNTASYLGENRFHDAGDRRFKPDNIILNSREGNLAFIIDHETGEAVWKIGPNYADDKNGTLMGMHNVHMIPRGLPGEGNILAFDNGGMTGYGAPDEFSATGLKVHRRDYSRVVEFDPVTMEIVWSFSAADLGYPSPLHAHYFYSPFISNAQRLPNGNTLITEGVSGIVMEVTNEKEVVWEYVVPGLGDIGIYRSYRVPYSWVKNLEIPQETDVIPPENSEFHLPGADDPSIREEVTVSIKLNNL
ncbi:MAG: aryl-sulfate sulfotransferase [Erysipelotrichaceae bacterium]|nr:aryl-sulfate sulfotransferase [Erysipelotrichaceae bacterium]